MKLRGWKTRDSRLQSLILTWRPPDVAPVVSSCFWPNLYCACAETATSELLVKILTPPLDSATLISYIVRIFWRLVGTYQSALKAKLCILWHSLEKLGMVGKTPELLFRASTIAKHLLVFRYIILFWNQSDPKATRESKIKDKFHTFGLL